MCVLAVETPEPLGTWLSKQLWKEKARKSISVRGHAQRIEKKKREEKQMLKSTQEYEDSSSSQRS